MTEDRLAAKGLSSAGYSPTMTNSILARHALGPSPTPWPTIDPFLFCVHHLDLYPRGNARLGPDAALTGRQIGQDFAGKDGWNMYHGRQVPGFPSHPHRGFETVTLVRQGLIDHSDSLGAAARFGHGDVQWLTAGQGIVHAEMFPLLNADGPNTAELFQIWLNLPAAHKMAPAHFKMLWGDQIPAADSVDAAGQRTHVTVVAGRLTVGGEVLSPPAPPPHSWAAQADNDVAIWTLRMDGQASFTLPPAQVAGTRRMLYIFTGQGLAIDGAAVRSRMAVELKSDQAVTLKNADTASECLLLQGRPIAQPVVSYGPFVMNTREEIEQALRDYRDTAFGGWPWPDDAPIHGREARRFARQPDGTLEQR
jgi:quercetin 2,3-dioxygenase